MVKDNKARDTVKAVGLSILFYFIRYLLVTASSSQESPQLPETQKNRHCGCTIQYWGHMALLVGWNSGFCVENPVNKFIKLIDDNTSKINLKSLTISLLKCF